MKEINLDNKVVLDVETYINLKENIINANFKNLDLEKKYYNLINYLLSECKIEEYTSGKKYLCYDNYNNHIGEFLRKMEPDLYEKEIEREEK